MTLLKNRPALPVKWKVPWIVLTSSESSSLLTLLHRSIFKYSCALLFKITWKRACKVIRKHKLFRLTRVSIIKRKRGWIRMNDFSSNYSFNSFWSGLNNWWHFKYFNIEKLLLQEICLNLPFCQALLFFKNLSFDKDISFDRNIEMGEFLKMKDVWDLRFLRNERFFINGRILWNGRIWQIVGRRRKRKT